MGGDHRGQDERCGCPEAVEHLPLKHDLEEGVAIDPSVS